MIRDLFLLLRSVFAIKKSERDHKNHKFLAVFANIKSIISN